MLYVPFLTSAQLYLCEYYQFYIIKIKVSYIYWVKAFVIFSHSIA